MKRCYQATDKEFKNYGGRGIRVCERWHEFREFYKDMGERPDGLSIERKDSSRNYTADNCVWANAKQQARNRRTNTLITVDGVTACIVEMSEKYSIHSGIISNRLFAGWSHEESVKRPVRNKLTEGQIKTILKLSGSMSQQKIADLIGFNQVTVSRVLRNAH